MRVMYHNAKEFCQSLKIYFLILLILVVGMLIGKIPAYADNTEQIAPNRYTSTPISEQLLHINSAGNDLENSSGMHGAEQVRNYSSDQFDSENSGAIRYPYVYSKYQQASRDITNNLGNYHNGLENKFVGRDALKFNIHDNSSYIYTTYKSAMTYISYVKNSDGQWKKKKQPISVGLKLFGFNFYPQDYWSGTPNVFVSKNLSRGIYYNGISSMHAQYNYYDEQGNPISLGKDSYVTVHGLDGVATPNGSYLDHTDNTGTWKNHGSGTTGNNRLIPYYFTTSFMQKNANSASTSEQQFFGDNGLNKYKAELFNDNYDTYGKFVSWDNGELGYVSKDSKITYTHARNDSINGEVNTGGENSAYSNDRTDMTHAISFPISGNAQDEFTLGSSAGYGNFSLSADVVANKPHDEDQQPTTPIKKYVDKKVIHHQGEDLTYTIKGNLPQKQQEYEPIVHNYEQTESYRDPKTGTEDVYEVPESYTTSKPIYTNDSYDFTDSLPQETSVTSVSSSGALSNASQNGNNVTAQADNSQMIANSGGAYTITIHAKADKLPQPDSNGWQDSSPSAHGYYTFSNQANANVHDNGNNYTDTSNSSNTKIKRYKGTIWHYDFDNQENGDFDFINHGPDGDGDFGYHNNFDPDQGVLKKDTVYGYEGDTKNVDTLNDAYKNGNNQWNYRFAYGDQHSVMVKFNSPGDDGDGTTQDFYLPYIVPRSRLTNAMIAVDTDKKTNGLPFTLNMEGESFLYRDFSDYSGTNITVNVTSPDGTVLWTQTKPLDSLLTEGQHAINWTQWKGVLNTSQLNVSDGDKVPLNVQVTSNNPQLIQQDQDSNTATYGFTANDNQINGQKFGQNDNAILSSPEETIKYDDVDSPRVLSEMLSIHQQRKASGKTGYGLRQGNDLTLEYAGNMNVQNYLDHGTGLDYDFSSAYDQSNSGIDYQGDPRGHTYNVPNQSNDQGMQQQQGGLADRFDQTNHYNGSSYNELDNNDNYDMSQLDTYNQMSDTDQGTINNIDSDMPIGYSQYIQPASFKTTYNFAPRFTERDSGAAFLTQGTKDPLAQNRAMPNYNGIDAGQRMYTPYFMPLGKYDTYYSKADTDDTHRLGANNFDIDENRPTNFYGHMYLTAQSPGGTSDTNDELSIQPIIAHQQNVQGFSNQDNQWLKDQSGFFSK